MTEREEAPPLDDGTHPLANVIEFAFGCHHTNLSRVFTIEGRSYKVCCNRGAKFDSSVQTMSIARRHSGPDPPPPLPAPRKIRGPLSRSPRRARAFAFRLARRLMP